MKFLSFFLLCLLPLPTSAAYKSNGFVNASLDSAKNQVSVTVKRGFHLNKEAPNKVLLLPAGTLVKARSLSDAGALFSLPQAKDTRTVRLEVYVCDDALTTCEQRSWEWNANGTAAAASAPKFGFLQDDLAQALSECKASGKPVLLLFSARWCPGCMRMEKEIWSQKAFAKTLGRFVKVHLDADRFQNHALMEQYSVPAIPSSLILNCQGEELGRIVDYQEPHEFARKLDALAAAKDLPTSGELEAKAKAGDVNAATTLAQRYALTGANAQALQWYALVPEKEKDQFYWWAKVDQDTNGGDAKVAIATAQNAIRAFPETPTSLDWRATLADLQGGANTADGKATLQSTVQLSDALIQDPQRMRKSIASEPPGDYRGIEALRVYEAKAEALEKLGLDPQAKLAWKDGVKEGATLKIRDEPTGQFFRFLIFLKKAGENARLEKFFTKYLALHPDDPELLRRYAKVLFDKGDFQGAAKEAKAALAGSYEQNEIFAATLYADALAGAGEKAQAKNFLNGYLQRELPAKTRAQILAKIAKLQ